MHSRCNKYTLSLTAWKLKYSTLYKTVKSFIKQAVISLSRLYTKLMTAYKIMHCICIYSGCIYYVFSSYVSFICCNDKVSLSLFNILYLC